MSTPTHNQVGTSDNQTTGSSITNSQQGTRNGPSQVCATSGATPTAVNGMSTNAPRNQVIAPARTTRTKKTTGWLGFAPLRLFLRRSWVSEGLLWLLSLLLLATIVLVLALYDGRPLSDWHSSLSLNALLSVFVTLLYIFVTMTMSSCFSQLKWNHFSRNHPVSDIERFDQATQSVLGSLNLLLKRPNNMLVMFACLLTISVTAVGPFVQQILSLASAPQDVGTATLPIATVPIGPPTGNISLIDLSWNGFVMPADTKYDVTPQCPPNTNCSWDPYLTLMVKSDYKDVSQSVRIDSPCDPLGDGRFHCLVPVTCNAATANESGIYIRECVSDENLRFDYILSEGISFNHTEGIYWNDLPTLTPIPHSAPTLAFNTFGDAIAFRDKGNVLTDFTWLSVSGERPLTASPTTLNGTQALDIPPLASNVKGTLNITIAPVATAIECSLRVVGQKMNASYINNVFEEVLIEPPLENNSAIAMPGSPDIEFDMNNVFACNEIRDSEIGHGLVLCYPSFGDGILRLMGVANTLFGQGSEGWNLTNITDIDTVKNTVDNVARIFTRFLRTNSTWVAPTDLSFTVVDRDRILSALNDTYGTQTPPVVAVGTATKDVLTYKILWGWISLPASIVMLVGLLIVLTAIDTRRKKVPRWGRQRIASVVHGADEATRRLLSEADQDGTLDEVADHLLVQLSATDGALTAVLPDQAVQLQNIRPP